MTTAEQRRLEMKLARTLATARLYRGTCSETCPVCEANAWALATGEITPVEDFR